MRINETSEFYYWIRMASSISTSTPPIKDNPITGQIWKEDAKRLVLYADIMGFSHRVNYTNHTKLKESLKEFKQFWESRRAGLARGNDVRSVQFSDSILLVANGTDKKTFDIITKAAVCLMQSALKFGFPIKGVLAQGKFAFDKENELYFGLPLVEAYNLQKEIKYYGIVVHHSAEKTVKKYLRSKQPYYIKTMINLERGKTSHYHLLWHRLNSDLKPENIENDANDWLNQIEESVSGEPRIYVDNTRSIMEQDDKECENISEARL